MLQPVQATSIPCSSSSKVPPLVRFGDIDILVFDQATGRLLLGEGASLSYDWRSINSTDRGWASNWRSGSKVASM